MEFGKSAGFCKFVFSSFMYRRNKSFRIEVCCNYPKNLYLRAPGASFFVRASWLGRRIFPDNVFRTLSAGGINLDKTLNHALQ